MRKIVFYFALCYLQFAICSQLYAQSVAINKTGNAADNSAMLDVSSTTQGVLLPRISDANKLTITAPANGLLIYNSTSNTFNYYKSGSGWYQLNASLSLTVAPAGAAVGQGTAINTTGASADNSAILDVASVASPYRGVLIPRTTQASITTPVQGLLYFDNVLNKFQYYGSSWKTLCETNLTGTVAGASQPSVGVAINSIGAMADGSAILDVQSSTQGILLPRMTTTQRDAIYEVAGLIVYNTTTNTIDYYTGSGWYNMETSIGAAGIITGTATVCQSQNGVAYSITAIADATGYVWSYTGTGFTIATGANTNSITANFSGTATSGTLTVYGTNACGNGTPSPGYSITVNTCGGPFWTENFGTGCNQGNLASSYTGPNGTWAITNTGANGAGANNFFVSATESGMGAGNCGDGCLGTGTTNRTLHVGSVSNSYCGCFFCPAGDCGAAYDACSFDLCGGGSPLTDRRAESPTINCSGYSNITLSFLYMERGEGANDNATLWYFNGAVWAQLADPAKTLLTCDPQGIWTAYSIALPASADNNPSVKIGFRWVNNIDGVGNDPSFAVDDIALSD